MARRGDTKVEFAASTTRGGGGLLQRMSSTAGSTQRTRSAHATRVVAKSSLTKNLLERALNNSFLFKSLKANVISQIVASMFEVKVPAGRTIIHEGEDGDNFYVVTAGKFDCIKEIKGQPVKLLEMLPGMCFGELALLYNTARAASICATTDSTVWALDRESFNMTVVYHSEETRAAQILRSSQFFSSLNEHELTVLIHQTERKIYKTTPPGEQGEIILEKGKSCECLRILMEGEVTVTHLINKTEPVSRTLGPGQVFGVVEAVRNQTVDANVYATGKTSSGTTVLKVPKQVFEDVKGKLSKQIMDAAIVQYLARSPITKALNQEGLLSLCPLFVREKLRPYFQPFPNGMTKEISILDEGSVSYKGKTLSTPGKIFGEEVLNGQYRVPCITTGENGASMFVLKAEKMNEVRNQIEKSKMLATLKTVQLFISLSQSELEALADAMQAYDFRRDEILIKQGDPGDNFYILCFGELVVLKTQDDGRVDELMRLKEGCFGERALLENKPRAATIKAVTNGRVYTIAKEAFEEHLGSLSELMALYTQEVERQQMNEKIQFNDLQAMKTIGVGSFGRVRLVYHSLTNEIYGMKSLSKKLIVRYRQENHMRNERLLLNKISHPFCSRLIKSFNQGSHVHLVTEYSLGGELFHLLDRQEDGHFEESQAKFYAACVILVLEHLHSKGIIYRDLKPENLMLDTEGYIKVIDFGFSKEIDGYTYTVCGTPDYIAPEIITMQGHTKAVDYWSLGVLIYEMILGVPPFGTTNESEQQVYNNILDNNYHIPEDISADAADLISRLLLNDPNRRLGMQRKGIRDVKEHSWFRDIDFIKLERKKVTPPYRPQNFEEFDASYFDRYDDAEDSSAAPFTSGTWDDCF
ncbi:cGMP-dependent protein kinase [Chloropicon primus]|uniref:cGMP-dependent protein kinase n=1 Tax=Chloropicon primus TaxID=1764295 RepID=A0A5B8MWG3_9CHLO|nr:cGMP-dependent protein kinase [Chloropicon primus]UPR03095.1 cGMP-dependent protein kinase [Chloropicon primus]|eukprot:QDZ23882.1 cGMP-dependent protein kinase [Chloropicon primus]